MKKLGMVTGLVLATALSHGILQAQSVTATKEEVAKQESFFDGSSVKLFNYVTANDKGAKGDTTWGIEPHYSMPVLKGFAEVDVYGRFKQGGPGERAHFNKPPVTAELRKIVANNDYVYFDPYIAFDDLLSKTNISMSPVLSVILQAPIKAGGAKFVPYVYTDSRVTFFTGSRSTSVKYYDPAEERGRFLTADEIKEEKLPSKQVMNVDKAPIYTYHRAAVSIVPDALSALKITAGANLLVNKVYTPIVGTSSQTVALDYESNITHVAQPMLRLEYKVSDKIHLRNTTTIDYQKNFAGLTKAQKDAGSFSNATRLIYTIY